MGMLGLRDVFVVAPTASFHQAAAAHHEQFLSAAEAHPIIPLLAAAPYLPDDPRPSKIQLSWQTEPPPLPQNPNPNSTTAPSSSGFHSSTPGATTCQDCGNQAKKDCTHRRCRTCCKSRGFDCSTHIKSTWVPASRRRERHLAISAAAAAAAGSSASTSASKKPRIFSSQTTTNSHTSNSNTPSRSFDTSSSHQDASFRENLPGHVRAPALFRCVRVASIDGDGEDEYAYHAKVTIGGHVFKGFLYDQGVDDGSFDHTGATSTAADANAHNNISADVPKISELNLSAGISGAGVRRSGSSSFAAPPSHIFGESAGVARMLGGSAFGNQSGDVAWLHGKYWSN